MSKNLIHPKNQDMLDIELNYTAAFINKLNSSNIQDLINCINQSPIPITKLVLTDNIRAHQKHDALTNYPSEVKKISDLYSQKSTKPRSLETKKPITTINKGWRITLAENIGKLDNIMEVEIKFQIREAHELVNDLFQKNASVSKIILSDGTPHNRQKLSEYHPTHHLSETNDKVSEAEDTFNAPVQNIIENTNEITLANNALDLEHKGDNIERTSDTYSDISQESGDFEIITGDNSDDHRLSPFKFLFGGSSRSKDVTFQPGTNPSTTYQDIQLETTEPNFRKDMDSANSAQNNETLSEHSGDAIYKEAQSIVRVRDIRIVNNEQNLPTTINQNQGTLTNATSIVVQAKHTTTRTWAEWFFGTNKNNATKTTVEDNAHVEAEKESTLAGDEVVTNTDGALQNPPTHNQINSDQLTQDPLELTGKSYDS
ncbi:MAG: hypothetical protein SFT93_03785 [Rickettsiaceae bacterium]|nr:hypothetical protein [Rickettsiaceae bacterium]